MATAKPKRFRDTVRDGVVAVEVGPERVKHFVHKALLEEHSEYFQKALNGSWKEGEDKVVCLDDIDFGVFSDWLYTGKLPAMDEGWNEEEYRMDLDAKSNTQWHTATQVAMLKAYAFADRMLSPGLRKALEHEIIAYFVDDGGREVCYRAAIHAFAHLPSASPVLQVMIDAHCQEFARKNDTEEDGELQLHAQLPNAFLIGVMKRLAKLHLEMKIRLAKCSPCKYYGHTEQLDKCDYHGHSTKKERRECRRNGFGDDSSDSDSSSGF
ncbi:hypothetical protein E8E12_007965 [Didymella heteroderae]|uniref:BTB domain-containing protein n=1 Tax=Didymella heteroderae TaxID=1769908 RepID=A0A9P4WR62_9PLEO|nr:hypothetical protein E8E12_007965 [Didymella heteroderae]